MTVDPIDCLVEIAQLVSNQMNSGNITPAQSAFTLGGVMGIACRVPAVLERLQDDPWLGEKCAACGCPLGAHQVVGGIPQCPEAAMNAANATDREEQP